MHFIQKFEESNATPAGGYSAKWLPTVTTEMEDGRGMCACRETNMMVSKPQSTSSYQTPHIRGQTHNAKLEGKTETKREEQNEIKASVSYLQRFKTTTNPHTNEADRIHMDLPRKEKRRGECEGLKRGEEQIPFSSPLNKSIMKENETRL